jgi:GntR family transcriptional regulator
VTVPQHQRLTEALLGQIADGTVAVGDKLPSEATLCAQYGVARGTIRQALGRIEGLGMITRAPGVGSVVVARAPVSSYQPAARSLADIAVLAAETRLSHPSTSEFRLDATTARRIGARRGTEWFLLEGARVLRRGKAAPLCWSEHFLRADLNRDKFLHGRVEPDDLQDQQVQQVISAALISEKAAQALGAEVGSAALVVTRRHRDLSGRLISVGVHTHPADRYSIAIDL